jgi:hypothetical protein
MKQKYKYIKSLVFNLHGVVALVAKNNHLIYTLDLKGIIQLPYYIIGVNYEVRIFDQGMTASEKVFNYNDPLVSSQMQILAESTSDIYGDNINYTLTPDVFPWLSYSMTFQPGRVYNLLSFPIVISNPKQNVVFDVYVDPAYTVVGNELQCIPSFKLFIGTN